MRFNGIIFKKFVFLKYQHPPRLSKLSIFLIFIRLLPPDFQPVHLKIRLLMRTFGGFFYALTISLPLLHLLAPLKPEQLSQMGFPNNWRTEKLWG